MATNSPRVNVVLENHENVVLTEIAAERERTMRGIKTSTHDAVWRRGPRRK
jgi:hypothetical protein